jgi:peroxiredoxin
MIWSLIIVFAVLFSQLGACQGLTIPLPVEERAVDKSVAPAGEPADQADQTAEQSPALSPTSEAEATTEPALQIGDVAPDFTLPTLSGEEVSLRDFRGKVVLLNFWATWCGPCRSETPDLQRLYEKYQDQNLVVVGVSVDEADTVEAVPGFIEEFGLTYPILLDTDLQTSVAYEGNFYLGGIPKSYFIDPAGVVQDIGAGALEWDFMEGKALRLLDPEAGETRLAALELVLEGRELAEAGDIEGATAKFEAALGVDPTLSFKEPEAEAREMAAQALVIEGENLAGEGDIEAALAAYAEAQRVAPTFEIPDLYWNNLCWFGSLWGYAAEVIEACDKGVALADAESVAGHRDSRGLARALTGDLAGAIEDFEVFVAWSKENGLYEEYGAKREAWVAELKAGRNPFDQATLEALRNE